MRRYMSPSSWSSEHGSGLESRSRPEGGFVLGVGMKVGMEVGVKANEDLIIGWVDGILYTCLDLDID